MIKPYYKLGETVRLYGYSAEEEWVLVRLTGCEFSNAEEKYLYCFEKLGGGFVGSCFEEDIKKH